MSVSPQKHPASEALAGHVPPAGQSRAAEKLILLTLDEPLREALFNVAPRDSLTVVADESSLSQHLLSDHAGVAFIDTGALHAHPGAAVQLAERLHTQLPDLVLVFAGDSAAQNELAGLVTEGTVYRFVHKPVSAQRLRLFVEAAWRKRDGTNASGLYPALSMPPPPAAVVPVKRKPPVPWALIGAAVVAIGAGATWLVLRSPTHRVARTSLPASAPTVPQRPLPATPTPVSVAASSAAVAAAAAANAARKAADFDRLATGAEQALLAGNLAEAVRLTDAARAIDPDHVRVKFLAAQIAREQARLSARRRPETPAPQPAPRRAAPHAPTPTAPTAPTVAAVAGNTPANTVANTSSAPASAAASAVTPPAVEARDRSSAPPVTLQRVHSVNPQFPDFARQHDLSGYVDVEFTVLSDGSVANVTVVKSQPTGIFDKSATDAVRQWRYRPLFRDGVPTEGHARVRLNFAYK